MTFLLNRKKLVFLALYLALFFITCTNALFWDTMQFASFHPSWYYYNNFKYLWLPDTIDSGHPPFFGMYLAAVWKVLGRNLLATHLAMLPFVLLIVTQAVRLGDILFGKATLWSFLCTLVILSETALLGQVILASPDVVLMAGFLLALTAILAGNKAALATGIVLLSVISTRGMMCVAALFLFSIAYRWAERRRYPGLPGFLLSELLPFLPGIILAVTYLVLHSTDKGWSGVSDNAVSAWAPAFSRVDTKGFVHNLLILCWRIIDLGKIMTVLVFAWLLIRKILLPGKLIQPEQYPRLNSLLILMTTLFIIGALPLCFFTGLMGHRYLLPLTTVLAIAAVILVAGSRLRYKKAIIAVMILVQLSGNFWVYPAGLSTGWDSTLAQMPYYPLREDFKEYIRKQGIPVQEISSQFPLWSSAYGIDLGTDTTRYADALKAQTKYVWYANVCNSLQDSAAYYFRNFKVLKYEKKGQVEMALFERK